LSVSFHLRTCWLPGAAAFASHAPAAASHCSISPAAAPSGTPSAAVTAPSRSPSTHETPATASRSRRATDRTCGVRITAPNHAQTDDLRITKGLCQHSRSAGLQSSERSVLSVRCEDRTRTRISNGFSHNFGECQTHIRRRVLRAGGLEMQYVQAVRESRRRPERALRIVQTRRLLPAKYNGEATRVWARFVGRTG